MFRSKVIFILGAGSSQEVKLPTGEELIELLVNKLTFKFEGYPKDPINLAETDRDVYLTIKNNFRQDLGQYLNAAKRLSLTLPNSISIDNALHAHRHDKYMETCGH